MPIDGVSNFASNALDKANKGADKAKSAVSDGAEKVTDTASQAKDAATAKATDTWENATESVYDTVVGRGSDMAEAMGEVQENVSEMKENIATRGQELTEGIADRSAELKEGIADRGSEMKERLAEGGSDIAKTAGETALKSATQAPVESAKTVWEMMNSTEEFEPGPGEFDIEENPAGRNLVEAFAHLDEIDEDYFWGVGPRELSRVLNNRVFDDASEAERIELAANISDVRQQLIDETGNADLAGDVVEQVEAQVVNIANGRILDQARPVLEEGIDNLERINTNSDSRRAFLAGVATASNNEAEIVDRLENFGVPSSDAQQMAEILDEIRTNEFARNAFMDGNEGPKQGGLTGSLRSGAYDSLESDFEDILDDSQEGMERLHRDLGRQKTQQNNELLVDDYVAPIRDQVLADMGVVMEPDGETNELGEIFMKATDDAESSLRLRSGVNAAVTVGGSVVAAVATKGAAIPAIAGAMTTSGVSVADARMETGIAQGAVSADLADPDLLERAERDETVAYALAAADVLTAGAAGSVGTTSADVAGEAAGAANEFYGSTR